MFWRRRHIASPSLLAAVLLTSTAALAVLADDASLKAEADAAMSERRSFEEKIAGDLNSPRLRPVTEYNADELRELSDDAAEEYRRFTPLSYFRIPGATRARPERRAVSQVKPIIPSDSSIDPGASTADTSADKTPTERAPVSARVNIQNFRMRTGRAEHRILEKRFSEHIAAIWHDTANLVEDPARAELVVAGEFWVRDEEIILQSTIMSGWKIHSSLQWVIPEKTVLLEKYDYSEIVSEIAMRCAQASP